MSQSVNVLAVIPARGGSKGVPRKNIKPLLGKPLIAWTIEAAQQTRHPMRVIVSTDDKEIARVAKSCGAEVPFLRPAAIAQDLSTDVEWLMHALDWLRENEGYAPEMVVRLPPTSPLRTSAHIDAGIAALEKHPGADASRAICESPKHPYKMWKVSGESPYLEPFLNESHTGFADAHNLPRQIFPKVYIHTGAVDVIRPRTIYEQKSTSGKRCVYFFMEPEASVNIDTPLDFAFAEFLLQRRVGGGSRRGAFPQKI